MKALTKLKKVVPAKTAKLAKKDDLIDDASQMDLVDDVLSSDKPAVAMKAAPVSSEDKVGSMLKAARLKKELEVEDIAKKLCIRRVYLEAIESSDYEEIPDYPYGPGFVRSYADFLGLNGARLVQVFKDETCKKTQTQTAPYHPEESQIEAATPSKKYIAISIIAIVAVYLIWMFWNQYNDAPKDIPVAESSVATDIQTDDATDAAPLSVDDYADIDPAGQTTEELPVVEVSNNVADATPQVTVKEGNFIEEPAVAQTEEAKAPEGVVIKINQEAWVEVRDNDKLYVSKVLKPGDTYTLPNGGKNMKLSIGRYGAADVFVNGVLTEVVTPIKKTNIDINEFLKKN